jgi:hypothetical protein
MTLLFTPLPRCNYLDCVADNQRLHLVRQQALENEVALGSQALMDNKQRWKFALESTNEGVWDWDVPRDEVIVSPG